MSLYEIRGDVGSNWLNPTVYGRRHRSYSDDEGDIELQPLQQRRRRSGSYEGGDPNSSDEEEDAPLIRRRMQPFEITSRGGLPPIPNPFSLSSMAMGLGAGIGWMGISGIYFWAVDRMVFEPYRRRNNNNSDVDPTVDPSSGSMTGPIAQSQYRAQKTLYHKRNRGAARKIKAKLRHIKNNLEGENMQVVVRLGAGNVDPAAGVSKFGFFNGLYSWNGASSWDDMAQIATSFRPQPTTQMTDGSTLQNGFGNLYIHHAQQWLDITNTGGTLALLTVYKCVARSKCGDLTDPANYFVANSSYITGKTQESITGDYVSLFDSQKFTENILILDVAEVQIAAGQAVQLTHKVKGMRRVDCSEFTATAGSGKALWPGVTQFFVLKVVGAVENNAGTPRYSAATLSVLSRREYKFKFHEDTVSTGQVM